jgi:hypothetical protein
MLSTNSVPTVKEDKWLVYLLTNQTLFMN